MQINHEITPLEQFSNDQLKLLFRREEQITILNGRGIVNSNKFTE